MIDRHGNKIIIECDMCDETLKGREKEEFATVWAEARQGGWMVRKVASADLWLHYCPKCGPMAAVLPEVRTRKMIIVVSCPKCKSTRCHPTFWTAYSYGCVSCGHMFDSRGGFWRKVKAFLSCLFQPEPPVLSEEEQIERDWWNAIK